MVHPLLSVLRLCYQCWLLPALTEARVCSRPSVPCPRPSIHCGLEQLELLSLGMGWPGGQYPCLYLNQWAWEP